MSAVDQALAYAGQYEATLTVIVITENLSLAAAIDPMAYAQVLTVSDQQQSEHLAAVRERAKNAAIHVEVRGLFEATTLLPGLTKAEGQYADVALIPGADRWQNDGLRRHITEALIFAGVPTLVMPATWKPSPARHVALGWNASLEAFRAARAALNLVEPNSQIDVVIVDGLESAKSGQPLTGMHIARHLARHGHNANVHATSSATRGTAGALQFFAAHQNADLLIVGGYGRSRAVEFVLGGVTRELLGNQRLPILFVH